MQKFNRFLILFIVALVSNFTFANAQTNNPTIVKDTAKHVVVATSHAKPLRPV